MKKQDIPKLRIFQNKVHTRFIQWVARKFGYEILMVSVKPGTTTVDGNPKMFKYFDTVGFLFGLEPLLSRPAKAEPKPKDNLPNKLPKEQLEELGINL